MAKIAVPARNPTTAANNASSDPGAQTYHHQGGEGADDHRHDGRDHPDHRRQAVDDVREGGLTRRDRAIGREDTAGVVVEAR